MVGSVCGDYQYRGKQWFVVVIVWWEGWVMAYYTMRGGIVNIGVALVCWVGSNSLFDQLSWLKLIIVLESLCVITGCAQFMTYGRVSMFVV